MTLRITLLWFVVLGMFSMPLPVVGQTFDTWTTTSGHETQALLHGQDSDGETVTLLVPKRIPLSILSEKSKALAKQRLAELANKEREIKEAIETIQPETVDAPQTDPQYTIPSRLSDPSYAEWDASTADDKVALCGTMLFGLLQNNMATERLRTACANPVLFNQTVLELCVQIELMAMKLEHENPEANLGVLKVSAVAGSLAVANNWIRTNKRVVGEVIFQDLRFAGGYGDSFDLLGQATNTGSKSILLGGYHLNIKQEGELLAVETLMFSQLGPGETKSFKTNFDDLRHPPELQQLSILEHTIAHDPDAE